MAATISKTKTDRINDMVYKYSNKWHFSFNAKNSAILVYGENPSEQERNPHDRIFRLGCDCIHEKQDFDHVAIKACLYADCEVRVNERFTKARKALGAAFGTGIKKKMV